MKISKYMYIYNTNIKDIIIFRTLKQIFKNTTRAIKNKVNLRNIINGRDNNLTLFQIDIVLIKHFASIMNHKIWINLMLFNCNMLYDSLGPRIKGLAFSVDIRAKVSWSVSFIVLTPILSY